MEYQVKQKIKFSVLMSVYAKENPEWLRLSLDSVFHQSCYRLHAPILGQ